MSDLLRIALGAYLIGALIEGVITVKQLSCSLPELVKSTEHKTVESASSSKNNQSTLIIIALVSVVGAFSWPCRLIHRSFKE